MNSPEISNSQLPEQQDALQAPSPEEAMAKNQHIGQFLLELLNNNEGSSNETLDEALEKASPEDALAFLQELNSKLRNKDDDLAADHPTERECIKGPSYNGEYDFIAPDAYNQKKLLTEYLNAIKSIPDRDKKALLAYYAINNLRLFPDGNGRTARAVYILIREGSLSNAAEFTTHDTSENENLHTAKDISRNRKTLIKYDSEDYEDEKTITDRFLSKYHIESIESINKTANRFLQERMINGGPTVDGLDQYFSAKNITVTSTAQENSLVKPTITWEKRNGLGSEYYRRLQYALSDGTGSSKYSSSLSGLTIAVVLSQIHKTRKTKGIHSRFIGYSSNSNEIKIPANYLDRYEEDDIEDATKTKVENIFSDWKTSDYRAAAEVYRRLKLAQNRQIIDFFIKDTPLYNESTVVDFAMKKAGYGGIED